MLTPALVRLKQMRRLTLADERRRTPWPRRVRADLGGNLHICVCGRRIQTSASIEIKNYLILNHDDAIRSMADRTDLSGHLEVA
jgi:hypothetical protein